MSLWGPHKAVVFLVASNKGSLFEGFLKTIPGSRGFRNSLPTMPAKRRAIGIGPNKGVHFSRGWFQPFFSTIILFKNQIRFPRVSGGFLERRSPGKNGGGTPRMAKSQVAHRLKPPVETMSCSGIFTRRIVSFQGFLRCEMEFVQ